jgi:hypothetical protein
MTVGRKIYALICLSFIGVLGVALLNSRSGQLQGPAIDVYQTVEN